MQRGAKVSGSVLDGGCRGRYLIYYVNKGLSIVPKETANHLNLTTVREDGRDQGGAFVRREDMGNQTFPRRGATAHKGQIGA